MNIVIELLYGLNMKTCSYVEFSLIINYVQTSFLFGCVLWLKAFEVDNVIIMSY
jgi:hypothetical protein